MSHDTQKKMKESRSFQAWLFLNDGELKVRYPDAYRPNGYKHLYGTRPPMKKYLVAEIDKMLEPYRYTSA
jgi:hypothetical protein